jgi:hypothetical protein
MALGLRGISHRSTVSQCFFRARLRMRVRTEFSAFSIVGRIGVIFRREPFNLDRYFGLLGESACCPYAALCSKSIGRRKRG